VNEANTLIFFYVNTTGEWEGVKGREKSYDDRNEEK
jgi:hypothetical protein